MKKLATLFVLVLLLGLLAACHPARTRLLPVQNTIYGSPSMQNIERSIMVGASKDGWAVESKPGVVSAAFHISSMPASVAKPFLESRESAEDGMLAPCPPSDEPCYQRNTKISEPFFSEERIVYVNISYDTNAYKIKYADSKNMGFDLESDSVYEIYSQLVYRLDRAIQAELTAAY